MKDNLKMILNMEMGKLGLLMEKYFRVISFLILFKVKGFSIRLKGKL